MEANQNPSKENQEVPPSSEANGEDTAPEQNDLAARVQALEEELKQEKNKYLYLYAEFETYKKRVFKERSDLIKFGHENFARDLLLAKDNFERALMYTDNLDGLVAGLKMVLSDMKSTLERFGITEVKSVGEKFDPSLHEAVGQEESSEDGVITQEQLKGYCLHGRLLRPAKVVVGIAKK